MWRCAARSGRSGTATARHVPEGYLRDGHGNCAAVPIPQVASAASKPAAIVPFWRSARTPWIDICPGARRRIRWRTLSPTPSNIATRLMRKKSGRFEGKIWLAHVESSVGGLRLSATLRLLSYRCHGVTGGESCSRGGQGRRRAIGNVANLPLDPDFADAAALRRGPRLRSAPRVDGLRPVLLLRDALIRPRCHPQNRRYPPVKRIPAITTRFLLT